MLCGVRGYRLLPQPPVRLREVLIAKLAIMRCARGGLLALRGARHERDPGRTSTRLAAAPRVPRREDDPRPHRAPARRDAGPARRAASRELRDMPQAGLGCD